MRKKIIFNTTDLDSFHEALEGVKPLVNNKIRLNTTVCTTKIIKYESDERDIFHLSEAGYLDPVHSDEFISYKQISISNKILRKLVKGQYNVDAILDLHGMTTDEARTAVDRFLQQCMRDRIRVALIIHGKGRQDMPILKNKLNHWLREVHTVLAFCSAAPKHGNHGALYVLFKHPTEEAVS
jgi:DNA-nicking Smr family endonuclease